MLSGLDFARHCSYAGSVVVGGSNMQQNHKTPGARVVVAGQHARDRRLPTPDTPFGIAGRPHGLAAPKLVFT